MVYDIAPPTRFRGKDVADTTESARPATGTLDIVDRLAGIAPESALARLRAERPDVARFLQGSYDALLEPADLRGVSQSERDMIALRVAILTPNPAVAALHRERLSKLGAGPAIISAIESFPNGGALSPRDMAILRHTDLLIREPGEATPEHIVELKSVGLGPRDIVTIAQLISFESMQVRVLTGLRLLGEGK